MRRTAAILLGALAFLGGLAAPAPADPPSSDHESTRVLPVNIKALTTDTHAGATPGTNALLPVTLG
ncbi:hypothetical protein GCM10010218_09500 [Streptomyces mashuensis]|uniref:Secreted protein n=1 Tax=Streptomyces mashuensis TaxID=33904 RepID=A0A919AXU9_9ACTN|nr:hypothetical protein [Streptomyces mashuensis]GHF30306.1 hypothetical protein GCM10010218_09500 [Streptomyces mashuensis]